MAKFDYHEFTIGAHFLPALINGDYSGLDDTEVDQFTSWLDGRDTRGHWDVPEHRVSFDVCEICELHADCVDVRYYFRLPDNEHVHPTLRGFLPC